MEYFERPGRILSVAGTSGRAQWGTCNADRLLGPCPVCRAWIEREEDKKGDETWVKVRQAKEYSPIREAEKGSSRRSLKS